MRGTRPPPSGRSRRLRAGLVLGVALALSLPAGAATGAPGDWTRWKFDAANTGVNPSETRLGPGNVRGLRRTWFRDQCCVGTPLVAGGTVYAGTEDGPGGPGAVTAMDAATGTTRWTSPAGSEHGSGSLALADGRVFALPDGGAGSPMVALDAASGRRLWTTELTPGTSTSFYAPPNVAGGVVYMSGGDGTLLAKDVGNGVNR